MGLVEYDESAQQQPTFSTSREEDSRAVNILITAFFEAASEPL